MKLMMILGSGGPFFKKTVIGTEGPLALSLSLRITSIK